MAFYPSPDGESVNFDKRVGDFLVMPQEPPVGTVLLCSDKDFPIEHPDRNYRVRRDERGWYQTARPRGSRWTWETVCKLGLPASIVSLPEPVDGQRA